MATNYVPYRWYKLQLSLLGLSQKLFCRDLHWRRHLVLHLSHEINMMWFDKTNNAHNRIYMHIGWHNPGNILSPSTTVDSIFYKINEFYRINVNITMLSMYQN